MKIGKDYFVLPYKYCKKLFFKKGLLVGFDSVKELSSLKLKFCLVFLQ